MILPSASLHTFSTAALVCVFSIVLFSRLRAARYGGPSSLLLTALCVAQPVYIFPDTGFRSALFAISTYAMCAAAMAFGQRQDPRRVVLLGGSLAGAQLIHPMCGAAASIALPVTLRRSIAGDNIKSTVGVVVSVLFIPALVAIGSLYVQLHNGTLFRWSVSGRLTGQALALASLGVAFGIAPLFTMLKFRPAASAAIVGVLALIATAGSFASAVFDGWKYVLQPSAVGGGLLLYIISEWAADKKRVRLAMYSALSNSAAAYFLALAVVRLGYG